MSRPSGPGTRRSPGPWAPAAAPRSGGSPSSRLLDHGAALLAQELRDVVRPAPAFPGRARSLPPAKRLRPGPGPGGGAGALVHVTHPGVDLVEEALDLFRLLGEDAGGEAVLDLVHFGDRLLQPRHRAHGEERDEQLLPEEWRGERQLRDPGGDEASLVARAPAELPAAQHDPTLPAGPRTHLPGPRPPRRGRAPPHD